MSLSPGLQNPPWVPNAVTAAPGNGAPPPYTPGQRDTQTSPVLSDEERRAMAANSTPIAQFLKQANREAKRLEYQFFYEEKGRKQTLHRDENLDIQANAENNVRERWVEQKIWRKKWGLPWPEGTRLLENHEAGFLPIRFPIPGLRWAHEPLASYPSPPPANPRTLPMPRLLEPALEEEVPSSPCRSPAPVQRGDPGAEESDSELDLEASRPEAQFRYQLRLERQWFHDQNRFDRKAGMWPDYNLEAFKGTKANWIEDGIWNPKWEAYPSDTWMHEDYREEQLGTAATREERIPSPVAPTVEQDSDQQQQQQQQQQASDKVSEAPMNLFGRSPDRERVSKSPRDKTAPDHHDGSTSFRFGACDVRVTGGIDETAQVAPSSSSNPPDAQPSHGTPDHTDWYTTGGLFPTRRVHELGEAAREALESQPNGATPQHVGRYSPGSLFGCVPEMEEVETAQAAQSSSSKALEALPNHGDHTGMLCSVQDGRITKQTGNRGNWRGRGRAGKSGANAARKLQRTKQPIDQLVSADRDIFTQFPPPHTCRGPSTMAKSSTITKVHAPQLVRQSTRIKAQEEKRKTEILLGKSPPPNRRKLQGKQSNRVEKQVKKKVTKKPATTICNKWDKKRV